MASDGQFDEFGLSATYELFRLILRRLAHLESRIGQLENGKATENQGRVLVRSGVRADSAERDSTAGGPIEPGSSGPGETILGVGVRPIEVERAHNVIFEEAYRRQFECRVDEVLASRPWIDGPD
jgi:hypothetical protein